MIKNDKETKEFVRLSCCWSNLYVSSNKEDGGIAAVGVGKRDFSVSDNPAARDGSREHGGVPCLLHRTRDSWHAGVRQSSVALESDALFTEEAHRDVAPVTQVRCIKCFTTHLYDNRRAKRSDITVSNGLVAAWPVEWTARVAFPPGVLGRL